MTKDELILSLAERVHAQHELLQRRAMIPETGDTGHPLSEPFTDEVGLGQVPEPRPVKRQPDPEIVAITKIDRALTGLDVKSAFHVLDFLWNRYRKLYTEVVRPDLVESIS